MKTKTKKREKKFVFNKDQLGLILGVAAIIIIVGFLFFLNKDLTVQSTGEAGSTNSDFENSQLTVSCNAKILAEINSFAVEKGCSIN